MKKHAMAFALAFLTTSGVSGYALADMPGADWMPAEQVKQKLMGAGYTEISELDADDGHWEGEGVKNGKRMQFHADAKSGAVVSEKLDH